MSLVMFWEVFVEVVRRHKLENGVTQKLQPLVGAHCQVTVAVKVAFVT